MISYTVIITSLILYYHPTCVTSEAFSSTANLIQLVKSEKDIIRNLEDYIVDEENRLAEIKRYMDEIKDKQEPKKDDDLFYAGHPVNAYNLIKRWYRLSGMTPNTPNHEAITAKLSGLQLPSHDDFIGASAALVRLQRTFSLPVDDVARGTIKSDHGASPLQADDFVHIGNIALNNREYGLAGQWLERAVSEPKGDIPNKETFKSLTTVYKAIGDIANAAKNAGAALSYDPLDEVLDAEYNSLRIQASQMPPGTQQQVTYNSTMWQRHMPSSQGTYERLCRGEDTALMDPAYNKDLVCRYRVGKLPYITYKEEILSWDPRIGLFYDVISDASADMIKEKAYPLLKRGTVGHVSNKHISRNRISKVAWLWDEDQDIHRISKRVTDITGLATQYRNPLSSAEPFQVVNYGIGGQYEPHVDYYESTGHLKSVPDYILNTGDRLCTFLFYLTDVKHGGATVFPRMNLRVPVTKNGAAFWYNAKLSGQYDKRTEHAGCPVLLGQKWVSNKWIREFGQEFIRPCGLTPDAIDRS